MRNLGACSQQAQDWHQDIMIHLSPGRLVAHVSLGPVASSAKMSQQCYSVYSAPPLPALNTHILPDFPSAAQECKSSIGKSLSWLLHPSTLQLLVLNRFILLHISALSPSLLRHLCLISLSWHRSVPLASFRPLPFLFFFSVEQSIKTFTLSCPSSEP